VKNIALKPKHCRHHLALPPLASRSPDSRLSTLSTLYRFPSTTISATSDKPQQHSALLLTRGPKTKCLLIHSPKIAATVIYIASIEEFHRRDLFEISVFRIDILKSPLIPLYNPQTAQSLQHEGSSLPAVFHGVIPSPILHR
jgi:hypothetical protein